MKLFHQSSTSSTMTFAYNNSEVGCVSADNAGYSKSGPLGIADFSNLNVSLVFSFRGGLNHNEATLTPIRFQIL